MNDIDIILGILLDDSDVGSSINAITNRLDSLRSALLRTERSTADVRRQLVAAFDEEVEDDIEDITQVTAAFNREIAITERRLEAAERASDDYRRSIEDVEAELRELEDRLRRTTRQGDFSALRRQTDQTRAELRRLRTEAGLTGRSLGNASRSGRNFAQVLGSVGPSIIAAVGVSAALDAVVDSFRRVITTGVEFEASLTRLGAVSRATDTELARLERQSRLLGETTTFTAAQAVQAAQTLAVAGFRVTEIEQAQEGVLRLAEATGVDLVKAADVASITLRSFGIEAANIAEVNDVLARSITSANLDLTAVNEAFRLAAPVARTSGLSFEETANIINRLADAGFRGSIGGTALRALLVRIASPAGRAEDALQSLNIPIEELRNGTLSLVDLFQQLNDQQATAAQLADLFGKQFSTATVLIDQLGQGLERPTELLSTFGLTLQQIDELNLNGLDASAVALGDVANEASGLSFLFEQLNGNLDILPPTVRESVESLENLRGTFDANLLAGTEFGDEVNDARFALNALTESGRGAEVSNRDLAISLGLLTTELGSVDEASTEFFNLLETLNDQDTLNQLGLNIDLSEDGVVPQFDEILTQLRNLTESQPELITSIFGDDVQNVNALLSLTSEEFETLSTALDQYNFSTEVAIESTDNLQGDDTRLQSAASETSILLFERFSPALRSVTQSTTNLITSINDSLRTFDDFDIAVARNERSINTFAGSIPIVGTLIRALNGDISSLGEAFADLSQNLNIANAALNFASSAFDLVFGSASRAEETLDTVGEGLEELTPAFQESAAEFRNLLDTFADSQQTNEDFAQVLDFVESQYGDLLDREEARRLLLQGTAVLQQRLLELEAERLTVGVSGERVTALEEERDAVARLNRDLTASVSAIRDLSSVSTPEEVNNLLTPLRDSIEQVRGDFDQLPEEVQASLNRLTFSVTPLTDVDIARLIELDTFNAIADEIQNLDGFLNESYVPEVNRLIEQVNRQTAQAQQNLLRESGFLIERAVEDEAARFETLIEGFVARNIDNLDSIEEVRQELRNNGESLAEEFRNLIERDGSIDDLTQFEDEITRTITTALANRQVALENQSNANRRFQEARQRELDRQNRELDRQTQELVNRADRLLTEQNNQSLQGIEEARRRRETTLRELFAQIDEESLSAEQRLALIQEIERESQDARNQLLQTETDQILAAAEARNTARFQANEAEIAAATEASILRRRALDSLRGTGDLSDEEFNERVLAEEQRLSRELEQIQQTQIDAIRRRLEQERELRREASAQLEADAQEDARRAFELLDTSLLAEEITQEQFNERRIELDRELSATLFGIRRDLVTDLQELELSSDPSLAAQLGEDFGEARRVLEAELAEIALAEENFREDSTLGAEQLAFLETESFNSRVAARRQYLDTFSDLLEEEAESSIQSQQFLISNLQSQLELTILDLEEQLEQGEISIAAFNERLLNSRRQFRDDLADIAIDDVSIGEFLFDDESFTSLTEAINTANSDSQAAIDNLIFNLEGSSEELETAVNNLVGTETISLDRFVETLNGLSGAVDSGFEETITQPLNTAAQVFEEFRNLSESQITDEQDFSAERLRLTNEFYETLRSIQVDNLTNVSDDQQTLIQEAINANIRQFERLSNFIDASNPLDFGEALEARPNLVNRVRRGIEDIREEVVTPELESLRNFTQETSQALIDEYLNFVSEASTQAAESGDLSNLSTDLEARRQELFRNISAFETTAGIINGDNLNILSEEGRNQVLGLLDNIQDRVELLREEGGANHQEITQIFQDFANSVSDLGVIEDIDLSLDLDALLPDILASELESRLETLFQGSAREFATTASEEQLQQAIDILDELEAVRQRQLDITQTQIQQELQNRTEEEREQLRLIDEQRSQAIIDNNTALIQSLNQQETAILDSIARTNEEVVGEGQARVDSIQQSLQSIVTTSGSLQVSLAQLGSASLEEIRAIVDNINSGLTTVSSRIETLNFNNSNADSFRQNLLDIQEALQIDESQIRASAIAAGTAQEVVQSQIDRIREQGNQRVTQEFQRQLQIVRTEETNANNELQRQRLENERELESIRQQTISRTGQTEAEFNERNFRVIRFFREQELVLQRQQAQEREEAIQRELDLLRVQIALVTANPEQFSFINVDELQAQRAALTTELGEIGQTIDELTGDILDNQNQRTQQIAQELADGLQTITNSLLDAITSITQANLSNIENNIASINAEFDRIQERDEELFETRRQQIENANLTDAEREVLLDQLAEQENQRESELEDQREERIAAEEARRQRIIRLEQQLESIRTLASLAETFRTQLQVANDNVKIESDNRETENKLRNSGQRIATDQAETASAATAGIASAFASGTPIQIAIAVASILALLGSAFVAVRNLVQSNNQINSETFEDGGKIGNGGNGFDGGPIGGRLHKDGGTFVNAQRDEFIVNREGTAMFGKMISYMNQQGLLKRRGLPMMRLWLTSIIHLRKK